MEKMTEEKKRECATDIIEEVEACIETCINHKLHDLSVVSLFTDECRDKAQIMREAHGYDVSDADMLEITMNHLHDLCAFN